MNFDPKTKAWIVLISLVVGTGSAAAGVAAAAGAKWWGVLLVGLGTAGTNVYHALANSPNDASQNKP